MLSHSGARPGNGASVLRIAHGLRRRLAHSRADRIAPIVGVSAQRLGLGRRGLRPRPSVPQRPADAVAAAAALAVVADWIVAPKGASGESVVCT